MNFTAAPICRWIAALTLACLGTLAAPLVAAATLKVGLSLPLSGMQAGLGKEIEAAWRAFAKHANEKQLLKGHTLEVLVADDGFDPQLSKANAESLVRRGAVVMSGATGIPNTLAMLPMLESQRIPMLGPSSGSLTLRGKSAALFHVKASFGTEVDRMAALMATMSLKKVVVITDDVPDRQAIAERFGASLERASGGSSALVATVVVAQQGGKAKEAVAQALSARPDAVYVMTIPGLAGGVLKGLRETGYSGYITAWSVTAVDSVISTIGPAGAGIIFGTVMPTPTSNLPGIRANFRSFAKEQGVKPSYRAIEVYVTGRVLVEALARAPAAQPKGADVWTALENLRDASIDGWRISFSPTQREGSRFVDTMMLGPNGKFR